MVLPAVGTASSTTARARRVEDAGSHRSSGRLQAVKELPPEEAADTASADEAATGDAGGSAGANGTQQQPTPGGLLFPGQLTGTVSSYEEDGGGTGAATAAIACAQTEALFKCDVAVDAKELKSF